MKPPIFVRSLTEAERQALEAGLRSGQPCILRRGQILLASARGERAGHLAPHVGGDAQTVRHAIHAYNAVGFACLRQGSSRPQTIHAAFDAARAEQLQALWPHSPRTFGTPTRLWTLARAAVVSFEPGLTPPLIVYAI